MSVKPLGQCLTNVVFTSQSGRAREANPTQDFRKGTKEKEPSVNTYEQ